MNGHDPFNARAFSPEGVLVHVDMSWSGMCWPSGLLTLNLGDQFSQPLEGVHWPSSLQCLRKTKCWKVQNVIFALRMPGLGFFQGVLNIWCIDL